MTLSHKTCFNTSGQGFKKDFIRYQCYSLSLLVLTLLVKVLKKTLFAINAIFTSIVKTSFMTKGHGQGVLKRKNY